MKDEKRRNVPYIYKEEKMKMLLMLTMAFALGVSFFCFLKMYDPRSLYFTKSIASYLLIGAWLLLAAVCVVYALRADKSVPFARQYDNIFSIFTCAGLIIAAITAGIVTKNIVFCILALLSAVYFLPRQVTLPSTLRAYCGLITVSLLLYAIALTYFDYNIPVNSPAKLVRLFGLGTVALFTVYDIRVDLGLSSERAYNVVGSIALITLSLSTATAIALKHITDMLPITALSIAMSVYMLNFMLSRKISTAEPSDNDTDTESESENNKDTNENIENNADTPENTEEPDAQKIFCEVGEQKEDQTPYENG